MSLQLNVAEFYKCFPEKGTARNIDQMPELIAEGRSPLPVAGLIDARLQTVSAPKEVSNSWLKNYFDTGDASTCGGEKGHLVVLDAQLLREMNAETPLYRGAIALPRGMWDELKSQKEGVLPLTADEVAEAHGKGYNLQSGEWIPANRTVGKVWDHLGRGQNLKEYAQLVSDNSNGSKNVMNLYFNQTTKDGEPTMRLWFVDRSGDDLRSLAYGGSDLGSDDGRLVGVLAPEAHSARNLSQPAVAPYRTPAVMPLENKIQTALNTSQAFEHDGILYAPVNADNLKLEQ